MDFIKTYSTKRGRTVGAYVQIKDGKIKVVIPRNDIVIRQIGIIEGGIGVVIQDIETINKTEGHSVKLRMTQKIFL